MATKTMKANKLVTFTWTGKNKRGESVQGEVNGTSAAMVKAELRRQGIIANKVKKKAEPLFQRNNKAITTGDITIFTRQMSTMLSSGIPLIQAFDITGKGIDKARMRNLVFELKTDVESGTTFAEALHKHPAYFNELYVNLIDAGEQSGSLETMLLNLAIYKEKIETLKGKIKKALFYPAAVLIVAFIVSAALLIFVVPQFEELFKGFGAELPFVTRKVIDLSVIFQNYWWLIFGSIIATGYGFVKLKQSSPNFAHTLDRLMLKMPILGAIVEKSAIARFARTLAITFAAGLPLVDALRSVAGATGNSVFTEATQNIRENVATGQQLQLAMRTTEVFPNMVIQMVAIGEESGALESMLGKVADFYEEEVDNAVDSLSSLIEPLIMALLGIIIGGLVIAMYMPIFKLGSVV